MLHVLAPPNEHSPTATTNPWRSLRLTPPRGKQASAVAAKKRKCLIKKEEPDGAVTTPEDEKSQLKNQNRQRSISECYFAMKGVVFVLPPNECMSPYRKSSTNGGDIQQHLQSMFYLLRSEDTLKMAVKLESSRTNRTRYLVVVSCIGNQNMEESCLLGVDCNEKTTLGLVLAVWADVKITLDGDGGFSVSSNSRHHIFKPVSVQAMWSALQTLHKASDKAIECNFFHGGVSHSWVEYYEKKISSDRSCLNEWYAMDSLESRRPPSPDYRKFQDQRDTEVTARNIKCKLREVMMTVDLDEVTSKYIRSRLEEDLHMDLQEYKSFIDQEMLTIMGQMDTSTEIFDHLFLGSEWNASNLEELQRNGVGHILNVTREIDNFFPGMFDYLNIRVYDEEGTELLKHWDTTYKFINDAKEKGSKVLVHCKMGVSRSASVVIAYIMKANNWKLREAYEYVKDKRNCVQPNQSFMKQLETYQGILDASNHRHNTLWRSKSENNLKKQEDEGSEVLNTNTVDKTEEQPSGPDLYLENQNISHRPKSWSPDENTADMLFSENVTDSPNVSKNHVLLRPACLDGVSYSVSPNKALHLPLPCQQQSEPVRFAIGKDDSPPIERKNSFNEDFNPKENEEDKCDASSRAVKRVSSVKDRINELEIQAQQNEAKQGSNRDWLDLPESTGLVLNLASQFESVSKSNPSSPVEEDNKCELGLTSESELVEQPLVFDIQGSDPVVSQTKPPATKFQAILVRPETWNNKSVEILRANSETLLTTSDETNEYRRHSTNDLQCCKSEGDVIMRLRVNNESKDLNAVISKGSPKELKESLSKKDNGRNAARRSPSFRAEDIITSFTNSRSCTQETSPNVFLQSKVSADNSDTSDSNNLVLEMPKESNNFLTNLEKIFNNDEHITVVNRISSENGVNLKRGGSYLLCDSAINSQSSLVNDVIIESTVKTDAIYYPDNSLKASDKSDINLKTGLHTSDLNHLRSPHSGNTPSTTNRSGAVQDKTGDDEYSLKRTCSLDSSLPSRSTSFNKTQQLPNTESSQINGDSSDIPSASVQRSQSLRNSETSCKQNSSDTPKVLLIHGPKPYKSPSGKQTLCILDGATIMANGVARSADDGAMHYASAPLLYNDDYSSDYPIVPKAAVSQPNITTSCLITTASTTTKKTPFKEESSNLNETTAIDVVLGVVDDHEANLSASTKDFVRVEEKEVPFCSGIVKQHKEVLENKIASLSTHSWAQQKSHPPVASIVNSKGSTNVAFEVEELLPSQPNTELKPQQYDKTEEWKKIKSIIETQMQAETTDEGSPPGKVKRMTRQMELATGVNVPLTASSSSTLTTPHLTGFDIRPDLIIVGQDGKEVVRPELEPQPLYTREAVMDVPSNISSIAGNPGEEKSVKTLVDKFEVKEKPLRNRYFSETEVENLRWNPSNATVDGSSNDTSSSTLLERSSCSDVSCSQGESCNYQLPLNRKRCAECESSGECQPITNGNATKENVKIENNSLEIKPQDKQDGHCLKNKWPCRNSPVSGTSEEEPIAAENGVVPHRKVRKALGKSHPLSKLQNSNKQRLVSPFYYTM